MSLKKRIIAFAKSQGADLVGVAKARVYSDYLAEVRAQIRKTGAAKEDYMLPEELTAFFENLSDARSTLPAAKSILLLGVYSFDSADDYHSSRQKLQGQTARTYAYYPVVRQIAERVTAYIEEAGFQAVQGQQVPLKHLAADIGLGCYGWNGLLLTRGFGSFLALRAVITDAELEPDAFESPQSPCEGCARCIRACPTGALYAPYKINPALCINPLTRKEEDIPQALRLKMGNWLCGCDICQEVCPMNRGLSARAPDPRAGFDPAHHASHQTLGGLTRCPDLKEVLESEHAAVMKRNAVIALANIGSQEALDILRQHRDIHAGKLAEYLAWAIQRIEQQPGTATRPDARVP
jgi:epoxyqueuosine reductase